MRRQVSILLHELQRLDGTPVLPTAKSRPPKNRTLLACFRGTRGAMPSRGLCVCPLRRQRLCQRSEAGRPAWNARPRMIPKQSRGLTGMDLVRCAGNADWRYSSRGGTIDVDRHGSWYFRVPCWRLQWIDAAAQGWFAKKARILQKLARSRLRISGAILDATCRFASAVTNDRPA